MKRTLILIGLLIIGLVFSQILPFLFGILSPLFLFIRNFMTMTLLSFIMIEVGREFEIDLKNKRQYAVDYGVADANRVLKVTQKGEPSKDWDASPEGIE